ncbi:TPA: hypothetical protein RHI22_002073, partial [Acinetobacter baumannii]|nr:hypothetical protein [Acinetobacter baumannii]EKZ9475854.1 hypothetical protein [Acinetobacter baumannii]HCQ9826420.1 hypothetical protein [Acinetobacter baumannii]HDV0657612.1 hypothetical protein [Acinetobacter baumannii]
MASTAAERKAKQRQEMLKKGFTRKDLWLSKESLEVIEKFKSEHKLSSNDEAINLLLKTIVVIEKFKSEHKFNTIDEVINLFLKSLNEC